MFNAPNIKGPRFRKGCKNILTKQLYKEFLKEYPQHATMTFDQFKKSIEKNSEKMWKTVIADRDGIELPIGGSVFIGNTKISVKNNYDIQASIKANAPIKHRNYETDGHVAKIYYSPRLSKLFGRDRSLWSFTGYRTFKRTLAKEYPKNWKNYRMVESFREIVNTYKKAKRKEYVMTSIEQSTKNYNEFDL